MKQDKHKWRWIEGKVNTAEDHIKIYYGKVKDPACMRWPPIEPSSDHPIDKSDPAFKAMKEAAKQLGLSIEIKE
jgi:hypothetical protein